MNKLVRVSDLFKVIYGVNLELINLAQYLQKFGPFCFIAMPTAL